MKKTLALVLALILIALPVASLGATVRLEAPENNVDMTEQLLAFSERLGEMRALYSRLNVKADEGDVYASARLIVRTSGEIDTKAAIDHAVSPTGRVVLQYASPAEAKAAAERFAADPKTAYAVPDVRSRVEFGARGAAPFTGESFNSWGYGDEHTGMNLLFNKVLAKYGSEEALPEIVVAVCDSGLNANHPFFAGRMVSGYNFVNNNNNTSDAFGHGTFCAGVVIDGVLSNVKVMPLKVVADNGYFYVADVVNAIEYAHQRGCAAMNLSLIEYNPAANALYYEAINAATDAGSVCCVAAGNWSQNAGGFTPQDVERGLVVAAYDENHNFWQHSNFGSAVDVTGPGVDIYSTSHTGGYSTDSGTSFAAPHAVACCAMMKTYDPELTPDEIMELLKQNAVDDGYTQGGEGRLYVGSLFEGGVPAPIAGDADGNGTVNVADALMTLRVAMGLLDASSINVHAADMDGSGTIAVADALSILRRAMQLA